MATAIKIQPNPNRLKVAHNALRRTKRRYSLEGFSDNGDSVTVEFYDQFSKFDEVTITRAELEVFVLDHYSSVSDSVLGGEHYQYEDTRSAADYLDDNLREVLVDYLNAKRA